MKIIKSVSDLEQVRDTPLYATIRDIIVPVIAEYPEFCPSDDGFFVLIEREDANRVLDDLDMPWSLSEVPFESATTRWSAGLFQKKCLRVLQEGCC